MRPLFFRCIVVFFSFSVLFMKAAVCCCFSLIKMQSLTGIIDSFIVETMCFFCRVMYIISSFIAK